MVASRPRWHVHILHFGPLGPVLVIAEYYNLKTADVSTSEKQVAEALRKQGLT